MKGSRHKSALGILIGERSLVIAEVAAGAGESREVRRVAEMPYAEAASWESPAALGKALAPFLKAEGFDSRSAVIGLPSRRLVSKVKEVPPADRATLDDMLRLQAEGEFAAELKDLVYDYEGGDGAVLLVATPKADVDRAAALCEAAGLRLVLVTSAAIALGAATGEAVGGNGELLVIAGGPGGVEATAQRGRLTTAIRHLRSPDLDKGFAGSLRRAVLPMRGGAAEAIVWDLPGSPELSEGLGLPSRHGEAGLLGVSGVLPTVAGTALSVATALSALRAGGPAVDFLDSKLAPPKERHIPTWAWLAAAVLILGVGGGIWSYHGLGVREDDVARREAALAREEAPRKAWLAMNDKVAIAQGWRSGQPRYLGCLEALTRVFPDDASIFTTTLTVKEPPKPAVAASAAPASAGANNLRPTSRPDARDLLGQLNGKAGDQRRAQALRNAIVSAREFSDVQLVGTNKVGRGDEISFQITFRYRPSTRPAP